jgi:phage-related protein
MESVQMLRAKVATVAKTVADKAQAAAAKATAVAQWAVNAALAANPIGLVIAAALILIGLFVLLYKRSERVRSIVEAVGRIGKRAMDAVGRGAAAVVAWFREKIPAAIDRAKQVIILMVKIATLQIRLIIAAVKLVADKGPELIRAFKDKLAAIWAAIRDKASSVWQAIKQGISDAIGRAADAIGTAKATIRGYFDDLLAPIQAIIDKVQALIEKIKGVHLPDLNPFGRTVAGGASGGVATAAVGLAPTVVQYITIQGAVDPIGTARAIDDLGYRAGRITGAIA